MKAIFKLSDTEQLSCNIERLLPMHQRNVNDEISFVIGRYKALTFKQVWINSLLKVSTKLLEGACVFASNNPGTGKKQG